ncbi:hypothetical protein QAD02_005803 [Eretmocerus hayati]|uniref:Uncharacterized protein n=1 Tax=Eretmocerus hayati TaxID=131215 RepID=A0ACC2NTQ4_9HYME|nr:hypothetical protein QAD02_005803 [Eretmocerus hayati]
MYFYQCTKCLVPVLSTPKEVNATSPDTLCRAVGAKLAACAFIATESTLHLVPGKTFKACSSCPPRTEFYSPTLSSFCVQLYKLSSLTLDDSTRSVVVLKMGPPNSKNYKKLENNRDRMIEENNKKDDRVKEKTFDKNPPDTKNKANQFGYRKF